MSADPVTIVITRTVKAGREAAFEAAVHEWIQKAAARPGYPGAVMLRPPPGGREYGAVLKFPSAAAWEAFRDSADYRKFLDELKDHHDGERVEAVAGLEAWFAAPGATLMRVPPPWKMAVVTWVGVNLITLALTFTLVPLTAGWPWPLGFVTFNAGVVVGLTWLAMPVLTRAARPWLMPRSGGSS